MVVDDVSRPGSVNEPCQAEWEFTYGSQSSVLPVRMAVVAFAAAGLLVGSAVPSVVYGVHIRHEPLSFEAWTFSYPFNAVGLVSIVLVSSELARTRVFRWPWPIWPLIGLIVWSLASVLWSVTPEATASRAMVAVGIAAFGVWFGRSLRFDEQLLAVVAFSVTATVGSAVMIAGWPNIGRNDLGDWQGVFASSNSLGPANVIGMLAAVGVSFRYTKWWVRVFAVVLGAANAVMLTQTNSMTAEVGLVACVVAGAVVIAVRALARREVHGRAVAVSFGFLGVVLTLLIIPNLSRIASAFGQDPTLSSRTVIWSDMRGFIGDRPVRGYGYWAFWDNLDYSWASYSHVGRYYGSAHNSFYEMALGLGLIGLAMFCLVVLGAVTSASRRVWTSHSTASMWWAVLLGFVLVEHLMESFVLWHSYMWMLLIAAAFIRTGDDAVDGTP